MKQTHFSFPLKERFCAVSQLTYRFIRRQWLPQQKLQLLGQNHKVDDTKLYEGKKPSLRKSVQQAFARALSYKEQTSTREDEDDNEYIDKDPEDIEDEEGDKEMETNDDSS